MSTAACESGITYIDGDKGELLYRGFPIEQLAVNCDFMDICYLILNGELPNQEQKADFDSQVTHHTMVNEQLHFFLRGFRRDAHPMAVLTGLVGALSAFYHDSTPGPVMLPFTAKKELPGGIFGGSGCRRVAVQSPRGIVASR